MKIELDYTHELGELVETCGCVEVGRMLGITKAAVRAMINNGRQVFVKKIGQRWCYGEIKPWKHARKSLSPRSTQRHRLRRISDEPDGQRAASKPTAGRGR